LGCGCNPQNPLIFDVSKGSIADYDKPLNADRFSFVAHVQRVDSTFTLDSHWAASAVPEPETYRLVALGLAVTAILRTRRRT
jgi:hypothetical protein